MNTYRVLGFSLVVAVFTLSGCDNEPSKKSTSLMNPNKVNEEDMSSLLDIDSDGFLHIKENALNILSDKDIKEIAETNEYIKKGLMKFDKDMNLILDKRPKQGVVVSEDTLS